MTEGQTEKDIIMKQKILIIEPDSSFSDLEKDYLEMSEYLVFVETNGEAGLSRLETEDISLVLTEWELQDMTGSEVCKKIKEEKTIPVIFVSQKNEETDIVRAFSAGADDYISKPFRPAELVARTKAHLHCYKTLLQIREERDNVIEFSNLYIDKTQHLVRVDGEEINFSTKEFELLCLLAEHPNRVFSREEIFKELWNSDFIGELATVTVHIKKLRSKLKDDSNQPRFIETVWGSGYRFKM